jgi:hypothetical protein
MVRVKIFYQATKQHIQEDSSLHSGEIYDMLLGYRLWAGHIAAMGHMLNVYKSVVKLDG